MSQDVATLIVLGALLTACSFDARTAVDVGARPDTTDTTAAPSDTGALDGAIADTDTPDQGAPPADTSPEALACVTVQDCVTLTSAAPACHHVVCREGACEVRPSPDTTPCQDAALSPGPCERARCDGDGRCVLRLRPPESPCDDGLDCSIDDRCDDAGQCAGDDTNCP